MNKLLISSAAFALLPGLALAQDADVTPTMADIGFIFTTFMFLVSGFLVFFMAAGFAMLEAGLVRGKNVAMQLTKNIALFSLASLFFYLLGYNLMYPGDGWSIDGMLGAFSITSLEPVGLEGAEPDLTYASVGSDFFFQLMFCAATASIVSGALAERIKLWPFLVFVIVLTAVIYPIQASWKWGGGFLDAAGFQDFAGSTVVHSVGGWAALAGALILGPRFGQVQRWPRCADAGGRTWLWQHWVHSSCGSAGLASTADRSCIWTPLATLPTSAGFSATQTLRLRPVQLRR